MTLPEKARNQADSVLSSFCASHIPPHARDQIALSYEFRGNSVTLFEYRPRWDQPKDWIASAIAQFRFDPSNGRWRLYCADRNSKWHVYSLARPTTRFATLLEAVAKDPTGIFFG